MSHKSTGGSAREGAVLQAGVLCEVAAAAGRHLTSLRADGCSVSDAVLGALGTHCCGLGTLSLVGCRGVTDAGLAAVAAGCPRCMKERIPGLVFVFRENVRGVAPSSAQSRRRLRPNQHCNPTAQAVRPGRRSALLRRGDTPPPTVMLSQGF